MQKYLNISGPQFKINGPFKYIAKEMPDMHNNKKTFTVGTVRKSNKNSECKSHHPDFTYMNDEPYFSFSELPRFKLL